MLPFPPPQQSTILLHNSSENYCDWGSLISLFKSCISSKTIHTLAPSLVNPPWTQKVHVLPLDTPIVGKNHRVFCYNLNTPGLKNHILGCNLKNKISVLITLIKLYIKLYLKRHTFYNVCKSCTALFIALFKSFRHSVNILQPSVNIFNSLKSITTLCKLLTTFANFYNPIRIF